ncbi:hypothetical protein NZK33_05735 [Cyanobium sp. FGCU-6]|jgi:hypothetical protein|nr:hypothetical protein [Cyanobium sp. FGCU6]
MTSPFSTAGTPVASLLARLEELSRGRPDRVLRLNGSLPAEQAEEPEAFELLIFRGFSSSTTHPTAFDPDRPALPEHCTITSAELLQGPLNPGEEVLLAGPSPVDAFLDAAAW